LLLVSTERSAFPGRIRCTSVSVPYHIGNGWGGGLVPSVTAAVFAATSGLGYALLYPTSYPRCASCMPCSSGAGLVRAPVGSIASKKYARRIRFCRPGQASEASAEPGPSTHRTSERLRSTGSRLFALRARPRRRTMFLTQKASGEHQNRREAARAEGPRSGSCSGRSLQGLGAILSP
jgi:hypothetical protein